MRKKKILIGLALAAMMAFSFVMGVSAADTVQEIRATINPGITVKFDNKPQVMKDVRGSTVYPIIYNNVTYLPIRTVGDLMGIAVDWDQATQSVLLGITPTGTDLIDNYKPYYMDAQGGWIMANNVQSSEKMTNTIGGVEVDHWLEVNGDGFSTCSYNIGGRYKTLTFQVYSTVDTTLTVKGDNDQVLGEYELKGGRAPQTYTLNLLKTSELTFVRGKTGRNPYYIFDARLDADSGIPSDSIVTPPVQPNQPATGVLGTDLIDTYKPYYMDAQGGWIMANNVQSSEKMTNTIGGVEVDHWLEVNGDGFSTCSYNIGGKYNVLTFEVYSTVDTTLTVKGDDDKVLGEYELKGGRAPQTYTLNLLKTTELTFVRGRTGRNPYYIFNAQLS